MDYSIAPFGDIWRDGVFSVPCAVSDKYIKLASEYQLKALIIILGGRGKGSSAQIAKTLGITAADAEELMEFWISEGVVLKGQAAFDQEKIPAEPEKTEEKIGKKKKELPLPTLSPKDIANAALENPQIRELLNEAQIVWGRTISHSESEMLVNMVNFYGMSSEIILMILEYCRSLKEKGRSLGTAFILKIAKSWTDEGIETVAEAEEKLKSIEKSDRLWSEIAALAGITYKNPTERQREMVLRWSNDFSFEMICEAIEIMKENTDSPRLGYADKILKDWKSKGIKTPAEAAAERERFSRSKKSGRGEKSGEISRKPTYDIEKIRQDALNNTDIKY